jgi:protein-tyrosine phosphatase
VTSTQSPSAAPAGPVSERHRQPANFRDLGGLPLASGGLTRAGVLYRSDALYPGDDVPAAAPQWAPGTVIDLRSPGEPGGSYPWPAGVTVLQMPLMPEAAVVTEAVVTEAVAAKAPGPARLKSLYRAMFQAIPGQLAALVGMAASSPGPVLVHCAAGKDRTGVAVAVLLLAAGVEPASVTADYTATSANMGLLLSRLQELGGGLPVDTDAHADLLAAPAEAITVVIDGLMGWPGGPQAWVADHGGSADDVRQWRERLTA